jgi:PTS system nitrogen regulatory IIA component
MKKKKILTAKEVAQLLQTPMVTVLRWVYQGKIPCKQKKSGCVFNENEICEWARSHDLLLADKLEKEPDALTQLRQEESFSLKRAVEQGGIIRNLEGSDIYSVLKHAVGRLKLPENADREMLFNELINREEIASTGIGKGVAIPHPRNALNLNLEQPLITTAFLEQPVDFNAVDGEKVFVLFLMLSPHTRIHLKLLSRLSMCLRDKEFLATLEKKAGEKEILAKIEQIEKKLGKDNAPADNG